MTLFLTEAQVQQIVTMPDAIREVEAAFRSLGSGSAVNRPRQRVRTPGGVLHVMPAGLADRGYAGFKYYASFGHKTRFWFHLIDGNSGSLVAVMQADRLGQRRTGAASGVAAKYLARADASAVGLVGTGWQAESQLQAVCAVRPIRKALCYSRDAERRQEFAKKMSGELGIDVQPATTAEAAVRNADIIITATNSREPVVRGEWISNGAHINAVGSNRIEARELDDFAVTHCDLICVDSKEQAKTESGDLVGLVDSGQLGWDRIIEIGQIVAGKIPGRSNSNQITLFKSIGIAAEDVALGAWVYEQARERKIGKEIEL